MKIVSIEELEQRIATRFPNQPFKIINYTKITQPITIQCLHCGKISTYSTCASVLTKNAKSKQYLCGCYNSNNNFVKHDINKQKILELCKNNPNIEFVDFGYREYSKKYTVSIWCNNCRQLFNKDWESFLINQMCPHCNSRHNLNTLSFKAILPEEYELIGDYTGTENKVLIRHNCGFIWNIKPHTFIQKINTGYHGCPQCNHKRSRGEMRIVTWLQENNIPFIEEQIFFWSSNSKFRYDFYLPQHKTVIEYMGKQHYEEVNFFHDSLEERQTHDAIKKKEALEQGLQYLEISYLDFNKIETILCNWFNDYPERE